MSKFINKTVDLSTMEKETIIALMAKIIDDTSNSKIENDEYFEDGIIALGRIVLGLIHTGRIEFRISQPLEKQGNITKINIH